MPVLTAQAIMTINRYTTLLLHFCWMLLLAGACLFYRERLYTDAAYYLFMTMNKAGFHVELNRFVLALSEVFPVLAIKTGAGVSAILLMASVGHVLFHYSISALVLHGFKQTPLAFGVLMLQFVGLSSGYFTPVFELYYSCSLLFLLLVLVLQFKPNFFHYALTLLVAVFTLTGHPYACIVLLMLIPLCWPLAVYKPIYPILILLTLGVFIFKSYTATEYEKGKTAALLNNLHNAEYGFSYIRNLIRFLLTYYGDLLLVALSNTLLFWFSKNYLRLMYWVAGFVGLLALINLSNYGFEHTRYQEQVYFPLTVFTIAVFMLHLHVVAPALLKRMLPALGVALVAIRVWVFMPEQVRFTARIQRMQELITYCRQQQINKAIVTPETATVVNGIEANWSYPIESLLLSSEQGNPVSICTTEDVIYLNNSPLLKHEVLLRRWDILPEEALNQQYFRLPLANYVLVTLPPVSPKVPTPHR